MDYSVLHREQDLAHDELMEQKGAVLHRLGLIKIRNQFDKQTVEMAIKLIKEEVK